MIPDTNDIATEAQASHIEKPKSICVSFSLRTILVYTAGPISKSIPPETWKNVAQQCAFPLKIATREEMRPARRKAEPITMNEAVDLTPAESLLILISQPSLLPVQVSNKPYSRAVFTLYRHLVVPIDIKAFPRPHNPTKNALALK